MPTLTVLNIDVKSSSQTDLPPEDMARVWQVCEDFLRFLAANEGIDHEKWVAWAGDGGFLLLPETVERGERKAVKIAEWFATHIEQFLNQEYLAIDSLVPPRFRITIGQVTAKFAEGMVARVSNLYGRLLSLLLKYEREFGHAGKIAIWEEVWQGLDASAKKRFVKRAEAVKGKTIYDLEIASRPSAELTALVLRVKDEIDRTSVGFLHDELSKARTDGTVSLRKVIHEAFTPSDLFTEIVKKVYTVLCGAHLGILFRVGYAQPDADRSVLKIDYAMAEKDSDQPSHAIKLRDEKPYSAKLAFLDNAPIYVACTREEIKKKEAAQHAGETEKRRFAKTHDDQDLDVLASLACMPVASFSRQGGASTVHGVLCIDTPVAYFFSDARVEALERSLKSLVVELSLAELVGGLLQHFRS